MAEIKTRTIGQNQQLKVKITQEEETKKQERLKFFVLVPGQYLYYWFLGLCCLAVTLFVSVAAVKLGLRF